MKRMKTALSVLCAAAVWLAGPLPVRAIGFDAEEKYNAVFVVTSGDALGSGFAIGENCVVTNAHVLDDPDRIALTTYGGETCAAFLMGMDTERDIAVLGVADRVFPYLQIHDYADMQTGDDVYAVGAPISMAYTLTKGVVSAKERQIGGYTYIQTDAAVNEGNSGGPLLNDQGNVIGVNTMKMSDSEGIGLAIPMAAVNEFVQSLGIETDANGNVLSVVEPGESLPDSGAESPSPSAETPEPLPDGDDSHRLYLAVLAGGLCVSVAGNIALLVLLLLQRKKKQPLPPSSPCDPRERTDFQIDIWE